jgi:hypothetical protein
MEDEKVVPPKKRYCCPTLWVHGGIEELTQTKGKAGAKADTRGATMDFRTN